MSRRIHVPLDASLSPIKSAKITRCMTIVSAGQVQSTFEVDDKFMIYKPSLSAFRELGSLLHGLTQFQLIYDVDMSERRPVY